MSKRYTEIFGRKVQISSKDDVVEEEFGENGIRYSVWTNATEMINDILSMYDDGVKGLCEDCDAGLYVVYKDGSHWNSRTPELNKFKCLRRGGILSAVYDNGWFGYYYYNAVPIRNVDEYGDETYLCEPIEGVA